MGEDNALRKHAWQQELLMARLEMWQHALELVSKEVYDNAGQSLSLVKLNLDNLAVPAGEKEADMFTQSKELVGLVIQDLRRIASPVSEDLVWTKGLHAALGHETALMNQVYKTRLSFVPGKQFYRLGNGIELLFFRILQELLGLISVSAAGRTLELSTHFGDERIKAVIRDAPGKNDFFEYPFINAPGADLVTSKLYARARLIGAELTIKNKAAKGLEIVLQLPVPADGNFIL